MIPWATGFIAKPMVKQFGPYALGLLLVALIILVPYFVGRSHGKAKWHGKFNDKVTELRTANEVATHNANEVVKRDETIQRQNDAYAKLELDGREHLNRVLSVHQTELERQARSYRRAVEAANADTAGLRERLEFLTVAETCHEAWVGVAQ